MKPSVTPKLHRKIITALLALGAIGMGTGNAYAGIPAATVFPASDASYGCYRIPATVTMLDGTILAFAEGRPAGCADFGNIQIVMRKSTDKGTTWSPMTVVARNGTLQAGNAVPVLDTKDPNFPGGRLFLFYNTGNASESTIRNGGKGIREQWVITSTDGGTSWSTPSNITSQTAKIGAAPYNDPAGWRTLAMGPGHGLQMSNGRLVIPGNFTAGAPQTGYADGRAYAFYSDDHGATYKIGNDTGYPSANESTAAELSTSLVMINSRDQSGKSRRRIVSVSSDGGANFSAGSADNALIDPVCEGSLLNITWNSKKYLLHSNPASTTSRDHLTVRASKDDGQSWPFSLLITSGGSAYSDLTQVDASNLGIIYENGGNGIRFMKVPLSLLITTP
jgi:sialidase-1